MPKKLNCPICKKTTFWEGNPTRPFCSERCKLVDLGKWADGSYSLEGEACNPNPPDSDPLEYSP